MNDKIGAKSAERINKSAKTTPKKFKFKISRSSIKKYAILLVVALALFGVWELGRQGGSWGESDELRIVKAEKIASKKLLGLKLVSSEESDKNGFYKKRSTPSIENTFKPKDGNVDTTIEQIIQYAEADGWVRDDDLVSGWSGRKLYSGMVRLTVDVREYKGDIIIEMFGYENR